MSDEESRLGPILEALMSYARQDFSLRIPVSEARDEIDAIATGINLLAEELDGEVASRRELEAAHARLQTTQEQLLVAQKLAAVGQLANGVAHELNNPAAWVLLGLGSARRRLANIRTLVGPDAPCVENELAAMEETLADAHAGMERMRIVIGDLRALSQVDAARPVQLDLDAVVRSACQLARPAYRGVARLVLDLGGVPSIIGERERLGQLVTNLVINAAHAVAEAGVEHEISVTTRTDGDHVVLSVEDSGPGIPEALFERVFEPYFTTKPSDVGTGLGLALVRKIAERHGGTARVTHGALRGARVEVRLPCGVQPAGASVAPPAVAAPRASGRARVLIIDDEPMLLRALEQAIRHDHDVETALGGQAALDLLDRDPTFDLLICDLQMPSVDGVAVYEALASKAPALLGRLVLMSGGAVTPRAAQFLEKLRPRVLDKPLDLDEVLALAGESAAYRAAGSGSVDRSTVLVGVA